MAAPPERKTAGFFGPAAASSDPTAEGEEDDDDNDQFQFYDMAQADGRPVTVARDSHGHIIYPAFVPPGVEFGPVSPPVQFPRLDDDDAGPSAAAAGPNSYIGNIKPTHKASTDPLSRAGRTEAEPAAEAGKRPALGKKWQTDASQGHGRRGRATETFPFAADLRRVGTNVSYLNRALWQSNRPGGAGGGRADYFSSSESSPSEDEEGDDDDDKGGEGPSHRPRRRSTAARLAEGAENRYRRFSVGNDHYSTHGRVSKKDGRLRITVKETANTGYLAKAIGAAMRKVVPLGSSSSDAAADADADEEGTGRPAEADGKATTPSPDGAGTTRPMPEAGARRPKVQIPRLNIVIMVIGSRGDAQPFLKIGKVLKEEYGHRVRIATHPAFRDFVERDSPGLEFFSVGGDPSELMAFMVKNPGMIPKLETVRAGDIGRRRAAMAEMFEGFWRACVNATDDDDEEDEEEEEEEAEAEAAGDGDGDEVKKQRSAGGKHRNRNRNRDKRRDLGRLTGSDRDLDPFVADAIIANPPSFAHVHCAEALGIPLHLMFTFPYTPTQAFPHPLASIHKSNVDPGYTNWISYPLVEMMVWQGLGDLVNDFRVKTLGLDPVSTLWAPGATYRLHVPFTYLWSPSLVPKPEDWGDEVDVSGFVFLDLASTFQPPADLVAFLDAAPGDGGRPVYIGFGSIVVDDADRFTSMIFSAVRAAGVRALVSKGWGGLGLNNEDTPDYIYMLENTPHDWLFPRVRACVIHGGAGTTAIALKCGLPTMVVPFFGDQHFWGSMVARAGLGPEPVPYKDLTVEKLAAGISALLGADKAEAAQRVAADIAREGDGAANAVASFHGHLALAGGKRSMRCAVLPDRVAAWQLRHTSIRLSALAADVAVSAGCTSWRRLRLVRHRDWNDFEGPGEPVTGLAGSIVSSVGEVFSGIGGVPFRLAKSSNERKVRKERRRKARARRVRKAEAVMARARAKAETAVAPPPPDDEAKVNGHATANGTAVKDFQPAPGDGQKTESAQTESKANDSVTIADPPKPSKPANGALASSPGANDATTSSSPLEPTATTSTTSSSPCSPANNPATDFALHVSRGVTRSAHALAHAPVSLSLALAQGFHNAPRLYGDDTVRRPRRVTGIKSGLRAARAELLYGVYDGWTGLVRLPVRGWREGWKGGTTGAGGTGGGKVGGWRGGLKGLARGLGMGFGGWVLKDITAMVGPVGYTLKGISRQVHRSRGPGAMLVRSVRRARIVQGGREWAELDRVVEEGSLGGAEVAGQGETRRRVRGGSEGAVEKAGDGTDPNGLQTAATRVDTAATAVAGPSQQSSRLRQLRTPVRTNTFASPRQGTTRRLRLRGDSGSQAQAQAQGGNGDDDPLLAAKAASSARRLQVERQVLDGWETLCALADAIAARDRAAYPFRSRVRRRVRLLLEEGRGGGMGEPSSSAERKRDGGGGGCRAAGEADGEGGGSRRLPPGGGIGGRRRSDEAAGVAAALSLSSGAEGAAFESVDVARRALQALRDGRSLESVVGDRKERKSREADEGKTVEVRKTGGAAAAGGGTEVRGGKEAAGTGTGKSLDSLPEKGKETADRVAVGKGSEHGEKMSAVVDNAGRQQHATIKGHEANGVAK